MAGLGDLFGSGGTIEQLFIWGLLNQIISDAGTPALELLQQKVNAAHPDMPLAPPDLADAAVRNYIPFDEAAAQAALSGLNTSRFQTMVHLHGDAPAPGDLATALRRELIPEKGTGAGAVSFDQGIREGRLADKWTDMIKHLAVQWPSPTDALDAALQGQLPEDTAKQMYAKLGGDLQFYTWLFNSRGSAPTPMEALDMANRGIIPWDGAGPNVTSFHQAFLEGPWRDKWEQSFRELGTYVPPESTVSTLLARGVIDSKQAATWYKQSGLDDATAKAFIASAEVEALSDYRGLTQSTVLDMYFAQLISADDAKTILESLHVSSQAAELLLSYVDLRRSVQAVNNAISRIQSLYTARKITRETVVQSLTTLKIPGNQIQALVDTWELENSINVKLLTESQIVDALYYEIMTADEATTELVNIGYTPYDAWVLISVKMKAAQPGRPKPGPAPPQGSPVPGVT